LSIAHCLLLACAGPVLFFGNAAGSAAGLGYRAFAKAVAEGGGNVPVIPPVIYFHINIAV
jgi:hypothetical protein